MGILQWLENTPVANWVAASLWGYPITLTTHGLGMAIVVGIVVMIDLRVLGLFKGIPLGTTRKFLPYMWWGFAINAISGTGLFVADAERFFFSPAYQLKLLFIASGLVLMSVLDVVFLKPAAQAGAAPTRSFPLQLGGIVLFVLLLVWCLSMLVWLAGVHLPESVSRQGVLILSAVVVIAAVIAAVAMWLLDMKKQQAREVGSAGVFARLLAALLAVMSIANILAFSWLYADLIPGLGAIIAIAATVLVLGGIAVWTLQVTFISPIAAPAPGAPLPLAARALAVVSALYWWLAVILSGRLVAYLG